MVWSPSFECQLRPDGEVEYRIGHPLVDEFLEFVVGRARPNTVRAYAHDLSVFYSVVNKDPIEVRPKDVMSFVTSQRRPRTGAENVVRIADGSPGLSASTIKRRLAAVSSFYGYLITRDDVDVSANPVPRGIATRKSRSRGGRGLPLVRGVRRLPRILDADEVESLMGALRTERDRAMTHAMVLGGLRRCEVLGLRLGDLRLGEWRVLITEGKGGHERLVPLSPTFFATVARYMDCERPEDATTDSLFVSLKGARRGQPLSVPGLDQIISAARERAGLSHGTCHELRHTCFTRLREAGMAIEAIQAQAGHRSITSTRIYLHLDMHWLADEYRRAIEAIEAQASAGGTTTGCATATRRRHARGDVGRDWRQSASDGGHYGLLPGPTRGLGPSEHGGGRRADAAAFRPSGHRRRPQMCRRRRHRTGAYRGLQAMAGRPSGQEDQGVVHHDDPAPPQHLAHLLRANHGMGVRRRPGPPAHLLE